MRNTVRATEGGIVEWARQGMHFGSASRAVDKAFVKERLDLEDLYGGRSGLASVCEGVKARVAQELGRWGVGGGLPLDGQLVVIAEKVDERGDMYGKDLQVSEEHYRG